ncbi:MAG: glycosyltransferase, partial [Actinomycetota bacterium]|nr:glycosyltransferase [Actinomycetota bacterium]
IAQGYEDSRIRILALDHNVGLAAALNAGIEYALAPIIARQDQDDVSDPRRLERQLALLEREPRTVLIGSFAAIITMNEQGAWQVTGSHKHPVSDEELRLRLLWNNPFVHSSVVFRREAFIRAGGYGTDPELSWPEDYDLWSRMSAHGDLANVPEELLTYRQTAGGMSQAHRDRIRDGVIRIAAANLASASGVAMTDPRLLGLAKVLNSVPTKTASPALAWERVGIFLRACNAVAPHKSPHLLAVRARWASKIMLRSLDPRWGSLDAA